MRWTIVLTWFLAACASAPNTSSIAAGQTMDQVRATLGEPEDRQFRDSQEAWQYCRTGTSFGTSSYRIIFFRDGTVSGVESYSRNRPGPCSTGFKQIEFK